MLSSGCDVRECRVLLPKGVPNGKHHSFHPDKNSHSFPPDVSQSQFYLANVLPYPNVSQSPFYPDDFPPSRIFHIRRLTPDGKGGRFNFPGQTYPNLPITLTRRVSQPFRTVLIALTWRVSQPFCTVQRNFSWSFLIFPTNFWDILL